VGLDLDLTTLLLAEVSAPALGAAFAFLVIFALVVATLVFDAGDFDRLDLPRRVVDVGLEMVFLGLVLPLLGFRLVTRVPALEAEPLDRADFEGCFLAMMLFAIRL